MADLATLTHSASLACCHSQFKRKSTVVIGQWAMTKPDYLKNDKMHIMVALLFYLIMVNIYLSQAQLMKRYKIMHISLFTLRCNILWVE